MKKLILCVFILITLACHGCIYIPAIYTKSPTGSIDPSFITIGMTTKEDVILKCGDPSWVDTEGEKVIGYRWTTLLGVVMAGGRSGGAGTIESSAFLVIDFDEDDVVKNYKTTRDWSGSKWF